MRFGYARVSTAHQNNSREAQERMLREAGCDEVYTDEASGKSTEGREGLERMLTKLRKGDEVYAVRLDRLGRSTKDVLGIADRIKEAGASLQVGDMGLDTSTTTGEFMLTVIAAVAQMERRVMLERQAVGIEAAKAQGKYAGRKPTVRKRADEIVRLSNEGLSKRQIAERMGCSIRSVFAVLSAARRHQGTRFPSGWADAKHSPGASAKQECSRQGNDA